MSYQDSTGLPVAVAYASGARLALGYDTRGNASTRTIDIAGQQLRDQVTTSPAGRTLARALNGPGASASWQYAYDRDGRLTSAVLAGTTPTGVPTGTWAYTLDNASQRTRVTSPLTPAGGNTYAYAPSGALKSTSDPRFDAGFTYDALGRARTAGPITLSYGPQGLADRVSDGTVTEARDILPDGTQVGNTITTGGASRTVRYSLAGLLLDESGAVSSQLVTLPGAVSVQLPPPGADIATATWRYADLLGSVAWEATGSAAPAVTAVYDPDGNRLSGAPLSTDPARPNLTFGAQPTAPLSVPLSYMGARTYVPALGVFLQPDPVPDTGPTAYGYSGADPINASDPSGNFFLFDGQWWKENGGAVLKVAISVAVAVAVSAATAGMASGPAAAFVAGVAGGAIGGAAGNAAGQVAEDLVNGDPVSVDGSEVLVSAGIGAATGVVTGFVQAVRVGRSLQAAQQTAQMRSGLQSAALRVRPLAAGADDYATASATLKNWQLPPTRIVRPGPRPAGGKRFAEARMSRVSEASYDSGTDVSSSFSGSGSFVSNRLSQGAFGGP
jgi:RHS repeat-associated protein